MPAIGKTKPGRPPGRTGRPKDRIPEDRNKNNNQQNIEQGIPNIEVNNQIPVH